MHPIVHLILPAVAMVAAGCGGIRHPVAQLKEIDDNVSSLSYTADLRGTHFIKQPDGRYWVISEPVPDAAFSYDDQQDIDLALLKIGSMGESDDKEGTMSGSEDLPMTGRTASVVLARELLFRLNESAHNLRPPPEVYVQLYKQTLDTILAIAKIEAEKSTYQTTVTLATSAAATMANEQKDSASTTKTASETSSSEVKGSLDAPKPKAAAPAAPAAPATPSAP